MTNNLALCGLYQQESQNVKAKNYCNGDDSANNAQDCQQNGGTWAEQAPFNMPATYEETSPQTPTFFVLFPGVDPTPWVEDLGKELNDRKHWLKLKDGDL